MKVYLIALYGLLIIAGGIIGYVSKQSMPSLIMGGIFGSALLYLAYGVSRKCKWSYNIALGISLFLTCFFAYRYFITYAILPAGLMAIISAVVAALLGINRDK